MLEDAFFNNGGKKGTDIIIKNSGTTDIMFHMIEVEKEQNNKN